MAQTMAQVIASINNSELRIALEMLVTALAASGVTLTANLVGDVTGDVTGDLTGNVIASTVQSTGITCLSMQMNATPYVADGAAANYAAFIEMDASDATVNLTYSAPIKGKLVVMYCKDATNACTVTLTAGTFDGTNNIATFGTGKALILFAISTTRFLIIENIGSVSLSS